MSYFDEYPTSVANWFQGWQRVVLRNLPLIVDSIPAPVAVMTADGALETVNQLMLEYFGKTAKQLNGWSLNDTVHPDDLRKVAAVWKDAVETGNNWVVESRHRRADGIYRWLNVSGFPLRDTGGRIVRWCVLQIDIEELKRAEVRKAAMLDAALDCIVTVDHEGRITEFNPAAERTFGYRWDEVRGKQLANTIIPPSLREKHRMGFARYLASSESHLIGKRVEMTAVRADGSEFPIEIAIARIPLDGAPAFTGYLRDITERKQAERKLREREAELAHMTRVVMMGELAASIAHEVNQPLTSIVIDGEIGLRKLARSKLDAKTSRDLMRRIVANARRAAEIIARIRGMAAPRAPQQMLLSIEEVVQESVIFLGHELQSRDVSVSLDLAPSLPTVLCDRTQLQQVVMNFAMNAVQAMASSPRRNIQVRTMLENSNTVCCTIEDSGPGIETKDLPHLFDSFFTTKDAGMGLGLAICRSIIEAHGGQIRADNNSTLGGARFGFALPATRRALD